MTKADKLKQALVFDIKKTFILVIVLLFSVISLCFILIIYDFYHPLSRTINNAEYISGNLYGFLPLAFMMSILFISKLNRIKNEKNKRYDRIELGIIILVVLFSIIALFRVIDIGMMVMFGSSFFSRGPLRRFASVSFHILFYFSLSIILLFTSGLFFRKNGLKAFFPIYIIPSFYSLNADLIMRSNEYAAFSFFYPVYQFILEFGRMETIFIGALLNLFNFKAAVFTGTFPYRLILGGTFYSINLPCIGWEGIMGYTIIFLNFLIDIEKNNKMRLIWGVLGLIGTIFVNIFRLTIIFIAGELWDVKAAMLLHQHMGDFIFIIWIFVFIFFIDKYKKTKFVPVLDKVKSLLNLQ